MKFLCPPIDDLPRLPGRGVAALPRLGGRTPIYLDNNASTPVDPRVARAVYRTMVGNFGNAHSKSHVFGQAAEAAGERARAEVAALVEAAPEDVHFTAGATDAIRCGLHQTIAVLSKSGRSKGSRPAVACTLVEHDAVLDTLREEAEKGSITFVPIPVNRDGQINEEALQGALPALDLLCVMGANNETGTVYPIEKLARLAREHGAAFFTDAVQTAGKLPVRVRPWRLDMAVLTAHKIYGPKGIGALVLRADSPLAEGFIPPRGTPPTPGIVGLGEACRLCRLEMGDDEARIAALRDRLEKAILRSGVGAVVNGDPARRLAGTSNLSLPLPTKRLLDLLHNKVGLSAGAACSSGASKSRVLAAMGHDAARQRGALRIGVGRFTTVDEVDRAAAMIVEACRLLLAKGEA